MEECQIELHTSVRSTYIISDFGIKVYIDNTIDLVLTLLVIQASFFDGISLMPRVLQGLIDQQSVRKRSLHLMDTVNAKKRWTIIYWRVNKFLKETHIVTHLAKE
jgi:hypothetical protein